MKWFQKKKDARKKQIVVLRITLEAFHYLCFLKYMGEDELEDYSKIIRELITDLEAGKPKFENILEIALAAALLALVVMAAYNWFHFGG